MTPRHLAAVLLSAAVLAGCAGDDVAEETDASSTDDASVAETTLSASLTGEAEVPGPGADGTGEAEVTVDADVGEVCATITVDGVEDVTVAHIHEGTADEAGPVVVDLIPPVGGEAEGCNAADPALVESIVADPGGFYVNVHSEEFPDGAVRGQLEG